MNDDDDDNDNNSVNTTLATNGCYIGHTTHTGVVRRHLRTQGQASMHLTDTQVMDTSDMARVVIADASTNNVLLMMDNHDNTCTPY